MKRRDLIDLLEKNGWSLKRSDGKHDVYCKDKTVKRFRGIEKSTNDLQRPLSADGA